jgi:hypothetical protein
MRKLFFAGAAILVVVLMAWASGDPWKDKPYDQWTDNDIAVVLQQSPWSKISITAGLGSKQLDSTAVTSGSIGTAGGGNDTSKTSAGSLPEQTGGVAKNANAGPATYNAFWFSSRTIREALARRAVLHSGMDPANAAKFVEAPHDEYEVMVQGADMSVFQQRGEKAFEDAAFLQIKKSKAKVNASHVEFQRGADGTSVLGAKFFFPKKGANGEPLIAPDEKEVDFYLRIGANQLRTFFEPSKMEDSKGQDL